MHTPSACAIANVVARGARLGEGLPKSQTLSHRRFVMTPCFVSVALVDTRLSSVLSVAGLTNRSATATGSCQSTRSSSSSIRRLGTRRSPHRTFLPTTKRAAMGPPTRRQTRRHCLVTLLLASMRTHPPQASPPAATDQRSPSWRPFETSGYSTPSSTASTRLVPHSGQVAHVAMLVGCLRHSNHQVLCEC